MRTRVNVVSKACRALLAATALLGAGVTHAAIFVDATTADGPALPNVSSTVTVWNGRTADWSKKGANDGTYPLRDFVEYVELMSATGGSAERDLLKDPSDGSVLDDYDFEPLLKVCREILAMGAKPYLKLGNVPAKFSHDVDNGSFRVNVRPPDDDLVHYRYMKACAAALKAAFGVGEVRKWRFAVLTEADNFSWFAAPGKDAVATREAFFRLYDFCARAFAEELGGGLCFGTHLLYPDDKIWLSNKPGVLNYERFFEHCERTGDMLGLFTISYYSVPGAGLGKAGIVSRLPEVVASAAAHGFTNLVIGVDEGRVIYSTPGRDRKDLSTRAVGQSYEAALDVRLAKSILDARADYIASWGFFSGPSALFEGVPSFAYFTGREIARFAGLRRVPAAVRGTLPEGETLDAFAGRSSDGRMVRAAVGRFKDSLAFTNVLETVLVLSLPELLRGKTVRVETLTLDDRNNWFVDWTRDRVRHGIGDGDFSWSGDDLAPLAGRGLQKPEHRRLFAETLQRTYAEKAARILPVALSCRVSEEGRLCVPLTYSGNGAAFVTVRAE